MFATTLAAVTMFQCASRSLGTVTNGGRRPAAVVGSGMFGPWGMVSGRLPACPYSYLLSLFSFSLCKYAVPFLFVPFFFFKHWHGTNRTLTSVS